MVEFYIIEKWPLIFDGQSPSYELRFSYGVGGFARFKPSRVIADKICCGKFLINVQYFNWQLLYMVFVLLVFSNLLRFIKMGSYN